MQVFRADMADEILDVMNVVRQAEAAVLDRHHAGIDPVGHIDLVILQQGLHGVAQQRRVVAGQWGAHQHHRLILEQLDGFRVVRVALETHQFAEGLFDDGLFHDRDVPAVGAYRFDIEFGLFVFLAEPVQQLVAGSQSRGAGNQGHRAQGIGKGLGRGLRPCGKRVQHRALEFMQLVKHDVVPIRLGRSWNSTPGQYKCNKHSC